MTTTDERRFARLDQLFQAALAQPAEEREAWLATQPDDAALLDEVRELLDEDAASKPLDLEGFVDASWPRGRNHNRPDDPHGSTTSTISATTEIEFDLPELSRDHANRELPTAAVSPSVHAEDPEKVGAYRILGRLGRGGQATVYLAESAGEFPMQVALKRIRRGMDTDDIVERLRLERQILARLVHPNIGRIHGGGSDDQGRPYLVMEVIEGERVDHWCATRQLPVRRRLNLFLQACEAVDFAHQNLILHRDLKPSNILVTDDETVKLLDFGIAKVLTGDAASSAQPTVTGVEQRMLTPDYASPEQLLGLPLTTASDVYSLGVVLFLLISGRLPHAANGDGSTQSSWTGEHGGSASVSRAARKQREAGEPLAVPADRWLATAGGELDAVVGKALETAPARRYSSVRELADDVSRLLEDRPVLARRPSLGYRLLKLVRRHRVGVSLGALIVLSLLLAVIGTSWQAKVASGERQRAERQWAQAEIVVDFLVDLFEVSDPYSEAQLVGDLGELARPRGETVTARELLDVAAQRVGTGLGGDWSRQSRLRRAIARAYSNLSLYAQARRQLEAAATDLKTVEAPELVAELEIARASVARDLGLLEARQGHFDLAETLLLQAEKQLLAVGDSARSEVVVTFEHFGELELLRGEPDAADARYGAALELGRELYGERSLAVAAARAGLAKVRGLRNQPAEMARLLEQVLAVRSELLGDQHPLVLETLNDLAVSSRTALDYAAAQEIFEDLLSRQKQVLGTEHVELAVTLYNLATALDRLERTPEAEERLSEAWRLAERSAAETPLAAKILNLQGQLRERSHDTEGAAALYGETLALRRRLFGNEHPETISALLRLGLLWAKAGDRRAEPLLREALDVSSRLQLGNEATAYLALGELALATDRPRLAESELRRGLIAVGDTNGWLAGIVELRLAQTLERLGRRAEALESTHRARELLAASLGPTHSWTAEAETLSQQLADSDS